MKVLVYGMGITGQSAVKTMLRLGYKVYVYDENIEKILKENPYLADLGFHVLESLRELPEGLNFVIKSPGIPPENPGLKSLKSFGLNVVTDLGLVRSIFKDRKIIAVTGTNGKTTTVSLLGEIFKAAGVQAHVAGNIGVGMLEVFLDGGEEDVYILEVSSFQLEDAPGFRPDYGGILNISEDHLDWHGSFEAYKKSKESIYKSMGLSDVLVLGDNLQLSDESAISAQVKRLCTNDTNEENPCDFGISEANLVKYSPTGQEMIIPIEEIPLVGKHNLENILMASALANSYGLSLEDIRKGILAFKGAPHRIEYVKEVNGVRYYNDSKGTNVDSTIKAIQAFDRPIVLIAGGYDKKIDFSPLIAEFNGRIRELVLIGQTKEQIGDLVSQLQPQIPYTYASTMAGAVEKAKMAARTGDVVLLSPASASWGMYADFEDRGDDFKRILGEI